ncbi:AAA family ATPase [Pseudomonas sp. sp1636]|uniref:ATP-dependent nuclease n=1 Tax=Pseudomonas sp. sp1636 TaxID=3036707 RepID=UPI0025A55D7F|nr:AAA family ATPase [Pseudomonas sp. sp1636]MDM8348756.1 AAA family ATPase [Pseudomonas sp. sp1636]
MILVIPIAVQFKKDELQFSIWSLIAQTKIRAHSPISSRVKLKIKNISVRGYRTIKDELNFDLENMVTLVGPNNSGKTNTLRAIHLFFTGYENDLKYDFQSDICKGESSLRTNIQITIADINSAGDADLVEITSQVRAALEITAGSEEEITLYLTFSPNSNPVYRVFPNSKRPKGSDGVAYSRLERRLFDYVLGKFSIHYIPSEKSTSDLYRSLVMPYLFRKMHKVLDPHFTALNQALAGASNEINGFLKNGGLDGFKASFELPTEPDDFFRNLGFNLKDTNTTSVFQKGMGIQSAVLLASFCWIARQEKGDGKLSIWLLEEPESYLHPELASQCLSLLKSLSSESQVVLTTHSLGFVPQDPSKVLGVDLEHGWTKSSKFQTYHEATKKIRSSLGVKFSDYYNFSKYNVLVEGQTDRKYIEHVIDKLRASDSLAPQFPTLTSGDFSVHDYGGVKGLEGFLRATFEFVSTERASITLLDGDDAGDRARRDLQGFFGKKNVAFHSNVEFAIVRDRFAIEGLLPDDWIRQIHFDHPNWFEEYAEDAQEKILPFKIKDGNKEQFFNWFVGKLSSTNFDEWSDRWLPILKICEKSLTQQGEKLYV